MNESYARMLTPLFGDRWLLPLILESQALRQLGVCDIYVDSSIAGERVLVKPSLLQIEDQFIFIGPH